MRGADDIRDAPNDVTREIIADLKEDGIPRFVRTTALLTELKSPCEHYWQKTDHWLIDKCSKCGAERA